MMKHMALFLKPLNLGTVNKLTIASMVWVT